jgi:hypothetical protein
MALRKPSASDPGPAPGVAAARPGADEVERIGGAAVSRRKGELSPGRDRSRLAVPKWCCAPKNAEGRTTERRTRSVSACRCGRADTRCITRASGGRCSALPRRRTPKHFVTASAASISIPGSGGARQGVGEVESEGVGADRCVTPRKRLLGRRRPGPSCPRARRHPALQGSLQRDLRRRASTNVPWYLQFHRPPERATSG